MPTPAILTDVPDFIRTERLVLRAYRPGDGPALNAAVLETWDSLHAWIPWARVQPSVAESETYARQSRASFTLRTDLGYLVLLDDEQTVVGSTGLHRIDWDTPRFEADWVRKQFEGKGYVTEAVRGLCKLALRTLRAERIELHCSHLNERSVRVAERCGFTLEARLRNHARQWGSQDLRETFIFGLVRSDPAAQALISP